MKTLFEIHGINDVCATSNKQKTSESTTLVKAPRPDRLSRWSVATAFKHFWGNHCTGDKDAACRELETAPDTKPCDMRINHVRHRYNG
jgi:hypothetical protein